MKVTIAGLGKVGNALKQLFESNENIEIQVYDPPLGYSNNAVLSCDFLFLSVPTPAKEDGSCDTSIVEAVLEKSKAKINIVRSTVWVGFTDWANKKFDNNIVFMPEYGPSEFPNHPYQDISKIHWAIFGGDKVYTKEAAKFWEKLLYNVKVFQTDSKTAELLKLAENAYFYSKLTFFNQLYDLCDALTVNYDDVRMMLTEDFRISPDHSFIYPDKRKIGGKCLPKDFDNLIQLGKQNGVDISLLELMQELNSKRS